MTFYPLLYPSLPQEMLRWLNIFVIKRAYCFSRGPEFGSLQATYNLSITPAPKTSDNLYRLCTPVHM